MGNNFTLSPQKVSQVALFSTTHFESLCFVCVYTSLFLFWFLPVLCSRFCWVSIFYYGAVLGSSSVSRKPQWSFFHCFCGIYICSVGFFCISGIFGLAMQCVLHICIILDLYLPFRNTFFAAVLFLLGWDYSSLITYQLPLGLALLDQLQWATVYSTV